MKNGTAKAARKLGGAPSGHESLPKRGPTAIPPLGEDCQGNSILELVAVLHFPSSSGLILGVRA